MFLRHAHRILTRRCCRCFQPTPLHQTGNPYSSSRAADRRRRIHEIKHDGYRTLIVIDRCEVRAFTRNGNDWTGAFRRVVEACARLACETAMIDGEMVVQDERGLTDFHALRSAIHATPHRILFFAFDLVHLNGPALARDSADGATRAPQEVDQAGQALPDPVQRPYRGFSSLVRSSDSSCSAVSVKPAMSERKIDSLRRWLATFTSRLPVKIDS
jgi:ATP dependent DNA ligase domain